MVRTQPPASDAIASEQAAFADRSDPSGTFRPTGLLVSVRSVAEAMAVAASPVEVIDLKEPHRGPLGACDPELWHRCGTECPYDGAWSAALGESDSALQLADHVPGDFAFAKAGPSGLDSAEALGELWAAIRQRLAPTVALVAVAYADSAAARTLAPERVLAEALHHRLQTLLVDTFVKDGRTSLDHLGADRLRSLVAAATRSGCDIVLAGGVTVDTLPIFVSTGPRRIGVRGGVCRGNRRSEIDPSAVAAWAARLKKLSISVTAN